MLPTLRPTVRPVVLVILDGFILERDYPHPPVGILLNFNDAVGENIAVVFRPIRPISASEIALEDSIAGSHPNIAA